MSATQIDLGKIDAKALIASFSHNMEVGQRELSLVMRSNNNTEREDHLGKAKYHFMNAIRNAQGTLNPRTKDRAEFFNAEMLNEAVSALCETLNKSIVFNWKDSLPVLKITEVHQRDPLLRQDYHSDREFSMITSVDCGKLPWEKKQQIADQICSCISECLTGYTMSVHKRQEHGINDIKELQTMLRIAWHYNIPEQYDKVMYMALKVRGFDFE